MVSNNQYSIGKIDIVTPNEVLRNKYIVVKDNKIHKIQNEPPNTPISYELENVILFPAMINAHDHLLGSYYPKVGKGPYINWKPWDEDLKSGQLYAERSHIQNLDLYLLGSYRHLICGVTTVFDHIPHKVHENFFGKIPIRMIKDFALAHEVSEFDLKWGEGVEIEYKKAVDNDWVFYTHIEEGFDDESMRGIDYLVNYNALSDRTVLVHGIALSDKDIELISKAKAHFVWCPSSNKFMFSKTARVTDLLNNNVNVSLGTDSPMSGAINIFEEMQVAKGFYKEFIYNDPDKSDMEKEKLIEDFNSILTKMVTINPAKALRVDNQLGSIEENKIADLLFLKYNKKDNIYKNLTEARWREVALVMYEGKPVYGDEQYSFIFNDLGVPYNKMEVLKSRKIISTNPLELLKRVREAVGFEKKIPFLPIS